MWERLSEILPPPTEEMMEELELYEKRMGYDSEKKRGMRYKMSVYDEFLEEYEVSKKYHRIEERSVTERKRRDRDTR